MNRKSALRTLLVYAVLIAIAIYAITMLDSTQIKEMSYTELMGKIDEQAVQSIELSTDRLTANVTLKDEENIIRVVDIPSSTTFLYLIQDKVSAGEFELTVAEDTFM